MWEASAQLTEAVSLCPHWPRLGRWHSSDMMPSQSRDATLEKKKPVQDPKPGSDNSEPQRQWLRPGPRRRHAEFIHTWHQQPLHTLLSLIVLPTSRVFNACSVVNNSWIKNIKLWVNTRYSSCSPGKKSRRRFCLFEFGTSNNCSNKKQKTQIVGQPAMWTLTARN